MKQLTIENLQLKIKLILTIFCLLLTLSIVKSQLSIVLAQTANCGSGDPVRSTGLVTTPSVAGKFSSSGGCIVDNSVIFKPFTIPTYEDLKSIYFTQAKQNPSITKHNPLAGDKNQGDIPLTGNIDHLYYIQNGNLTIDSNIPGNQTGVIFIDGKLNINANITLPSTSFNSGIVFIVGGNVVIDKSVTRIDAVIISLGVIYTAGDLCAASSVTSSALQINGALIALNEGSLLKFCRKLATDNKPPAEIINYEPKYLIILRDLFSQTAQKWSEIP